MMKAQDRMSEKTNQEGDTGGGSRWPGSAGGARATVPGEGWNIPMSLSLSLCVCVHDAGALARARSMEAKCRTRATRDKTVRQAVKWAIILFPPG